MVGRLRGRKIMSRTMQIVIISAPTRMTNIVSFQRNKSLNEKGIIRNIIHNHYHINIKHLAEYSYT